MSRSNALDAPDDLMGHQPDDADPIEAIASVEMALLNQALGDLEAASGVLCYEEDMPAVVQGANGQLDVVHQNDDEAPIDAAAIDVTRRIENLTVDDYEAARRSIETMQDSGIGAGALKASFWIARLAATREEFASMMAFVGDKEDPIKQWSGFDVLVEEKYKQAIEAGATPSPKLMGDLVLEWGPKWQYVPPRPAPVVNCDVAMAYENAMKFLVLDKEPYDDLAKKRNKAALEMNVQFKFGRRKMGAAKTKWKYPVERARLGAAIKAMRELDEARRYALHGEPKLPKKPIEPAEVWCAANVFKGIEGRKKLHEAKKAYEADLIQYKKDVQFYEERVSRHESLCTARKNTLKKNERVAFKAISFLGVRHPDRGQWLRGTEPIRTRVMLPLKPPSFAAPVVKPTTMLERRAANVKAVAAAPKQRSFAGIMERLEAAKIASGDFGVPTTEQARGRAAAFSVKLPPRTDEERDRAVHDRAAQAAFRVSRRLPALNALAEKQAAAREKEKKKQEELDAAIAKRKEEESKAKVVPWLEEEEKENKKGRKAIKENKRRIAQIAKDKRDLAALEQEEDAAFDKSNAVMGNSESTTFERILARTKFLIAKAKKYAKTIKARKVPKVKSKGDKGYFNILMNGTMRSAITNEQVHETFEDVDADPVIALQGASKA